MLTNWIDDFWLYFSIKSLGFVKKKQQSFVLLLCLRQIIEIAKSIIVWFPVAKRSKNELQALQQI